MEIAAILLARAMAWIEGSDLNPRGLIFYPDIVKALVTRYGFHKFPQKVEDFDESKGIVFAGGRLGDAVIDQLVIYTYGIALDTRASTDESKRLLEDAVQWASKELGLVFNPDKKLRWQYWSQLTFLSSVLPSNMPVPFQKLADRISQGISVALHENRKYELVNMGFDFDPLERKHPLGSFTIQRRDNTPYSENKYFSTAPLSTELHIGILKQFENDLVGK